MLTPSQRPTREWPLLLLTIALVGFICFPLWQQYSGDSLAMISSWGVARWGRLLFGPEQILSYVCFVWAFFIFLCRYLEVRRQLKAFRLNLLPTDEGARILQEDARPIQRKVDAISASHGPFILANMIRQSLAKFAVSRKPEDVGATVQMQAEVDHGRLVASMATMNYLAWAIPAIGFFGTVRGLAGSMTLAGSGGDSLREATRHLEVAFDCTLVALGLSFLVMFFIHTIQREEEALVMDCQQWCLEHLVNRIYEPETITEPATSPGPRPGEYPPPPGAIAGTVAERVAHR